MRRMDSFGLVAFAIGALALLQVAAVNLRGTWSTSRHAARAMKAGSGA